MATRFLASATVGGLMVVGTTVMAGTEPRTGPPPAPVVHLAASVVAQGSLSGVVEDDRGQPVAGAVVSVMGSTTTVAVTDKDGQFEFATLAPGQYSLRAHIAGFSASRPRAIQIEPSRQALSRIVLKRAAPQILAAGVGVVEAGAAQDGGNAPQPDADAPAATPAVADDHSETAWRIRHARRGVLKDATIPIDLLFGPAEDFEESNPNPPIDVMRRTLVAHARTPGGFFGNMPFSGQFNLLTTSSFDTPEQLFSTDASARNIAYASVGASVGDRADWMLRGAITQADISSWTLAGSYVSRPHAQHRYNLGMSYSTQRYDGGNPLALRDVSEGGRNAGEVSGYDEFVVLPGVSVRYGAGYARYDYLENRGLFSPRLEVTVAPAAHMRVSASASRRALAPGAEEFLPPSDTGLWLPPQRTFSSIERRQSFHAERATTTQVAVERDFGVSTIALRAFRQETDDQLVTIFGASLPGQPSATLGHYLVGNAGDTEVTGYGAAVRTVLANRVRGSVEYSCSTGRLVSTDQLRYILMLAPSAVRPSAERIHDLSTAIETSVPETATHITVFYRVSDGFAGAGGGAPGQSRLDGRFDVQIRQSLPFMSFTSARWEMLLAVRNFFREAGSEQSLYDELLVVRPPKRVVGGVTLRF